MCADRVHVRPSLRDSLTNLRQIRSLSDVKTALVNWSLRPRKRQNCCGHYGDPGC